MSSLALEIRPDEIRAPAGPPPRVETAASALETIRNASTVSKARRHRRSFHWGLDRFVPFCHFPCDDDGLGISLSPVEYIDVEKALSGKRVLSIDVLKAVCRAANIERVTLVGPRRDTKIVHARFIFMHLLGKHCKHLSHVQIAQAANRDHTCEINSRLRVPELMAANPDFVSLIHKAEQMIVGYAR